MLELLGLSLDWAVLYFIVTLFAFVVATTLGIGSLLILLPFLMLKFPPGQAIALGGVVVLANDLVRVLLFRQSIQFKPALKAALTALPVALFASFLPSIIPLKLIQLFILLAVLYPLISQYVFKYETSIGERGLYLWGIVIGFIAGLVGTSGPPTAIMYRGYGLVLKKFVATVAFFEAGLQLIRLSVYASTGLLPTSLLPFACLIVSAAVLAVWIGRLLLDRLDPQIFRYALDVLLFIIACWLFYSILT